MFRARTLLLPLLSVAALAAGIIVFLTDRSPRNIVSLFGALLLWFLGCSMLIVWSAGFTIKGNNKNASDPQNENRITPPMKRAG